jgi:hypothetical protein
VNPDAPTGRDARRQVVLPSAQLLEKTVAVLAREYHFEQKEQQSRNRRDPQKDIIDQSHARIFDFFSFGVKKKANQAENRKLKTEG